MWLVQSKERFNGGILGKVQKLENLTEIVLDTVRLGIYLGSRFELTVLTR